MDLSLAAAQAASKCQKVEAADTAPAVIRVRKWHQGPCQINAPARIILLGQLSLYFLLSFSVFWKFPHELGLEVICPYSHDSCFLFCPPDFWVLFFLLIFFWSHISHQSFLLVLHGLPACWLCPSPFCPSSLLQFSCIPAESQLPKVLLSATPLAPVPYFPGAQQ